MHDRDARPIWAHLPLTRSTVGRDAERRSEPGLIERLRRDPSTMVTVVQGASLAVNATGGLAQVPATDLADLDDPNALWLFLGDDADRAELALVLPRPLVEGQVDIEGVPAGGPLVELASIRTWAPLRDVGAELSPHDVGLATTAVALAAWHSSHPRCSRCGERTVVVRAGWVRRCPADDTQHFPRTDPAVIMAVVDDADRLLLGHARHWPERRFSTLAGYIEPGEGAEAAVRREVAEETAVRIGEVTYRGSQPWPFPASLMFAFGARAVSTDIHVDGDEVTAAAWFEREELAHEVSTGGVLLPMRSSIARVLIEDWYGGALPSAGSPREAR